MTTNTPVVGALTLAGAWQASAYGMSVGDITIAMIPVLLGALGRVGFEMAKASDPINKTKWSAVLYLFGGTLISSPTISVLCLVLMHATAAKPDGVAFFGMLFAGFIGPKVILWLMNTVSSLVNKTTGLKLPQLGPNGEQEPRP